jgi:hypothetical protein
MRNELSSIKYLGKLILALLSSVFILLLFTGCSSSDQSLKVSGYRFTFEGNDYYIKSIYCPNNPKSCNYLISREFEALDSNQDRVIDEIVKGDVTIQETQRIYSYALDLLEKENRLNDVNNGNEEFQYTIINLNILFEITSFHPEKGDPLNQFKVVQNKFGAEQEFSLFIDLRADGSLDEVLAGSYSLFEAQQQYQETIEEGISESKISKANNLIQVN